MRIEREIEIRASSAIAEALGVESAAMIRPTQNEAHGDYQVNGLLPLAKRLGKPPRELAQPVAEVLKKDAMFSAAEVAGPGFINLRLHPRWVSEQTCAMIADRARLGVPRAEPSQRVVVDYSSPNVAKQMHVGHLRSTILGDALCRMLRFVGHEVVADNHLGDWGTQFGLLIVGMRRWGDEAALQASPIDELERVYRLASAEAKQNETFAEEARHELAKLQEGDANNRAIWQRFVAATRESLEGVYRRLDVHFDVWMGESAYHDMLPGVVQELLERGLARLDEGAVCVFFSEQDAAPAELKRLETPFIIRKKDGAYLYSTSDIATLFYRRDTWNTQRAIYVVDVRQSLHFQQLFALAELLGLSMRLEHVGFGTILGGDGKPLKTRDGGTVTLSSLLDEAEERARARIGEQGLEIAPEALDEAARIIGIGAVKYADLRQNRLSDYRFDWDKMISFQGNAGPYLQYAYARLSSIFRKGEIDVEALWTGASQQGSFELEDHAETQALAKHLLRFADLLHQATESLQPHLVCDHLYQLARLFSAFYEACPILKAEGGLRHSRLSLAALAGAQLRLGLSLLGIGVVERM